jgi:hypothetical protein
VIDRKYLEKALSAEREGREVRVTKAEIERGMTDAKELIRTLHSLLVKTRD